MKLWWQAPKPPEKNLCWIFKVEKSITEEIWRFYHKEMRGQKKRAKALNKFNVNIYQSTLRKYMVLKIL